MNHSFFKHPQVMDLKQSVFCSPFPNWDFDWHFPNGLWGQPCFHVLIGHLCIFGEMSIQVLCPFFNWVIFLLLSCRSSLCIVNTSSLKTWIANGFLPICGLSSLSWCCSWSTIFNFDEFQCYLFFLLVYLRKPLPNPSLWKFIPMFSPKGFIVLVYICL